MLSSLVKRVPTGARFNLALSLTLALAYKLIHRNVKRPPLPTVETPTWLTNAAVLLILYETPIPLTAPRKQHVLNCLVQNEPGVLLLVSGTLAARGFNIDSLVVCNTEVADLLRMTVVLEGQDAVIEQARRQIEDLVPVYAVLDYSNTEIIKRELLLARVLLLGPEYFQQLLDHHNNVLNLTLLVTELEFHPSNLAPLAALRQKHQHLQALSTLAREFGARVVDVSDRNCIIELAAKPLRISAFIHLAEPFGILELARSGLMALPRTPLLLQLKESKKAGEVVDVSLLPPG